MPEGPQVRRAGNSIESQVGSQIVEIHHPPSRKPWELALPVLISGVEVVGKNIFIRLGNGQTIYNHMLMWGSWRPTAEQNPAKPKRLNTRFVTTTGELCYFGGGILKLVDEGDADAIKAKLGNDILSAPNAEETFHRVKVSALSIGEALLSQELVAGIGNIYKSEGLFAAKINPFRISSDVTEKEFVRLFAFLQPQMQADIKRAGPITTTTSDLVKRKVFNFVYRRYHQPCILCGTKIERIYQGQRLKRSTYYCPKCQAV